MKIDYLKLANYARWACCVLLILLSLLALSAVCTGRFQHIITFSGFLALAWMVAKYW